MTTHKTQLDAYEQDIENNFENLKRVSNLGAEMTLLTRTALAHGKRKKSITLRIHELDLETMKIKASKLGLPYQTYINMLIHKDTTTGI
jgi:predicted DNA binding CopG/RHH family protein